MAELESSPVALVTGAAQGIGAAIATEFSRSGYRVALVDRNSSVEDTARRISADPSRILAITADVTDAGVPATIVEAAVSHFGQIDALVNNAAVSLGGSFLDTTDAVWDRTIAVNLTAPMRLSQAAARWMIEHGRQGRMVNISSVNAMAAERSAASYVATKGGIDGLTRAMAVDLAEHGITVNAIAPGPIRTEGSEPLFDQEPRRSAFAKNVPLGRAGQPEELGPTAVFLCSPGASFITGTTILVDGGCRAYVRLD